MVELSTKYVIYVISSIGAVAWAYFGLTGNLPMEELIGLSATQASYVYYAIGGAGILSILYTASVWDDIDPTAIVGLYILADIGAVAWGYYAYSDQLPLEDLVGLSAEMAEIGYLVIGAAGLISILIQFTLLDEGTSATDVDDVMG